MATNTDDRIKRPRRRAPGASDMGTTGTESLGIKPKTFSYEVCPEEVIKQNNRKRKEAEQRALAESTAGDGDNNGSTASGSTSGNRTGTITGTSSVSSGRGFGSHSPRPSASRINQRVATLEAQLGQLATRIQSVQDGRSGDESGRTSTTGTATTADSSFNASSDTTSVRIESPPVVFGIGNSLSPIHFNSASGSGVVIVALPAPTSASGSAGASALSIPEFSDESLSNINLQMKVFSLEGELDATKKERDAVKKELDEKTELNKKLAKTTDKALSIAMRAAAERDEERKAILKFAQDGKEEGTDKYNWVATKNDDDSDSLIPFRIDSTETMRCEKNLKVICNNEEGEILTDDNGNFRIGTILGWMPKVDPQGWEEDMWIVQFNDPDFFHAFPFEYASWTDASGLTTE